MDIYENIVIGNFLFGLGVQLGLRHATSAIQPSSINLLQQTPFDKIVGDVHVRNSRLFRIFEFKRKRNSSSKEHSKRGLLSDALSIPAHRHLESVSREIHWYIESQALSSGLRLRIIRYLDLSSQKTHATDLESFLPQFAEEAISHSCISEEQAKHYGEYLQVLRRCQGAASAHSGAVIIQVTGSGQVQYVVVDDIEKIFYSFERILSRNFEIRVDRKLRPRSREREGPPLSR